MRSLDPSIVSVLDDPFVMPVTFVKLQFDDVPLFVHTDVGDITIAGNTYTGTGDLGSIEGIEDREDASPSGITLRLSGINTNLLNEALLQNYFDRPVQVLFGMRDVTTGGMISTPFEIFAGKMDQMRVITGGQSSQIEVTAESEMIDFDKSLNRYFSDTELQRVYTGDLAFRYLADMVNARITTGNKLLTSFATGTTAKEPKKR
jgi:hypothetical protein